MKVALFFDGKNFYSAMKVVAPTLQVDYQLLASELVKHVAGDTGRFVGAHYYTGYSVDPVGAGKAFANFTLVSGKRERLLRLSRTASQTEFAMPFLR